MSQTINSANNSGSVSFSYRPIGVKFGGKIGGLGAGGGASLFETTVKLSTKGAEVTAVAAEASAGAGIGNNNRNISVGETTEFLKVSADTDGNRNADVLSGGQGAKATSNDASLDSNGNFVLGADMGSVSLSIQGNLKQLKNTVDSFVETARQWIGSLFSNMLNPQKQVPEN